MSPPREGPALLQGIVLCGICGKRMFVKYRLLGGRIVSYYICHRNWVDHRCANCQHIKGDKIDEAIGYLLLETITPMALEAALAVQQELTARLEEADRLRAQQVERVRYEADLARQRYMQVDPNNRLVAEALEADWNGKLRALREAQEACERRRSEDRIQVNKEIHSSVSALTTDFPRLWNDPNTSDRDRKRIVRLLLEDVTLIKRDEITMHVRFKGGTITTLTLPAPKRACEIYRTPPEVVKLIDELLAHHTDREIAAILNERGIRSVMGRPFNCQIVTRIREGYGLKSRYDHLREAGMLTVEEMAERLGVCKPTVKNWRVAGLLIGHLFRGKYEYLYEPPGSDAPRSHPGKRLADRCRHKKVVSENTTKEQYEV